MKYLYRKEYQTLVKWKNNPKRKSMLVLGARQIGKTELIKKFINDNYDANNIISIDFIKEPNFINLFNETLDPQKLINLILLKMNKPPLNLEDNNILFLDEIQVCPNALTSLKYFTDFNGIDVIASGSLLGISLNKVSSFPVGKVDRIEMHSLDFYEYCINRGFNDEILNNIKDELLESYSISKNINEIKILEELFNEYIKVGGMPECIAEYFESKNLKQVYEIQKKIVLDYKDDIAKYSDTNTNRLRARECFESIPRQLAKDNKKFQYSVVKPHSRAYDYIDSISWLIDANIVIKRYNLYNLELPLSSSINFADFRIYLHDISLLYPQLDYHSYMEFLDGNLFIYNGAIFESLVSSFLYSNNIDSYYFKPSDTLEIDFVTSYKKGLVLLEVKSGNNVKSKSLMSVKTNYTNINYSLKITNDILKFDKGVLSIPIYLFSLFIKDLI